MICPDKQLDMWEYCDNSVILANADWYYTKQQTEELIDSVSGMNPTEVQDMINRSIHSKADKTYVDEKDTELSDSIRAINSNMAQRYTKTETNNLLDMKVDKSTYSAYTATTNEAINNKQDQLISGTNIRTINGESILGSGDLVVRSEGDITSGEVETMIEMAVSGKQDTLIAGDNITIVNNVISSTASGDVTSAQVETMIATSISGKADTTAVTQDIATATNDMATQTWVQNQGYLTEHQSLSAYSTTQEMNEAISAATDDMATQTWVQNQGYLTEHQSLSAYSTTQEMNDAITAATADMATKTWVGEQGYLTEHQSLSAYSTTDEMNQAISAATDDMATETWVGNQGYITGVDLSNYATLQDIPTSNSALTNDAGYITSAALNGYATEDYVTAATNDMATETWVQNQGYLTEHQSLSAYSTTQEMNEAIAAATSGKADTTAVTQDIATATADMATQTWVQNQGYLTEHQSLSAYSTTVEMDNAIDAAVSGKADSTAVTQDIAAATDDMATRTWVGQQGYLTEHQSLSAYSTTAEMNDAITAATDDMATKTWVNQQGFLTEHQSLSAYSTTAEMNQAISAATSGKVDTSTYTAYTSATDTALQGKQSTLVSGTNIKTINNESILGSGNITVQGGGNPTVEVTQAEYDALVSAGTVSADTFYIITDATGGDLSNYYTKSETSGATQISTALNAKADTATTYTKTEVDTALGGKQATLVSGTNIKTINNESILGSGNITIEGGGGGGKAISAGTNISVTTGETADTINCTLPITATSSVFDTISVGQGSGGGGYNTLIGPNAKCNSSSKYNVFLVAQKSNSSGNGAYVNGTNNVIIGSIKDGYINFSIPSFTTSNSVVIGGGGISTDKDNSVAIGYQANVSGTTKTNINNQLTIDTSNQVYISNSANTSTYCLQEKIENTEAALGGLKLVKLSQSAYDALATKDTNTLYVIV